MATRLPQPGGDDGQWGSILNEFLSQAHNADGSLKPLGQSQIQSLTADLAARAKTADLKPVATSGSYTDLIDKPTIPDAITLVANSQLDTKTAALVDNAASTTTASLRAAFVRKGSVVINANDYANLTAAVAAAAGKVLVLPADYSVTVSSSISIPANTWIRAEKGAQVFVASGANTGVFIVNNGVRISGLSIDGGSATATQSTDQFAIYGDTVYTDVWLENLTITNWTGEAIRLRSSTRATITGCYIKTIKRVSSNYGSGIHLTYTGAAQDTTDALIDKCRVYSCAGSGIQLDGDWNRTDWRTAGAKVYDTTISNCVSHSNSYAGIFINSGFRVTVANCHTNGNADYGVGFEYSSRSTINACTAKGNVTSGYSVYNSGERCSIVNSVADTNSGDGVQILWQATVSGDTATTDTLIADCQIFNNALMGVRLQTTIRSEVNGCVITGNVQGVYSTGSTDALISNNLISANTASGVRFINTKTSQITGNRIQSNGQNGVSLEGATNATTADILIASNMFRSNTFNGVNQTTPGFVQEITVTANDFISNLIYGYVGDDGSLAAHILSNHFRGNGSGAIRGRKATDWEIISNSISGSSQGIDLQDVSTNSGTRLTVKNNFISSTFGGIKISSGSGTLVAANDFYVVEDNTIVGTLPYSFVNMGSVAPLRFKGSGTGVPNTVIYGAPGSIWQRTDGGAGTSFYIKETGLDSNGWASK